MSSDWAAKKAGEIFNMANDAVSGEQTMAIIATALREAARVPEGCVRDDKGKDWPRGDYAVEYLAACLDKFPALAPATSAAARGVGQ